MANAVADAKNEMLFVVHTDKTVAQAAIDFAAKITAHKFTVLKEYDLKAKFEEKQIPFKNDVRILEVCSAPAAAKVLGECMEMSTMLPCRVSIYSDKGKTHLATMYPSKLATLFPHLVNNVTLKETSTEVERVILAAMKETVAA